MKQYLRYQITHGIKNNEHQTILKLSKFEI